jgi:translation initiation factor 2D
VGALLHSIDDSCRKGPLKPVQVTMKVRQGRKVCTLISGFEPYLVVDAEDMAEELRKVCAGATSGA